MREILQQRTSSFLPAVRVLFQSDKVVLHSHVLNPKIPQLHLRRYTSLHQKIFHQPWTKIRLFAYPPYLDFTRYSGYRVDYEWISMWTIEETKKMKNVATHASNRISDRKLGIPYCTQALSRSS